MASAVRQASSAPAGLRPAGREPALSLPVAVVAVDVSLPHLDRLFEYLVPASLAAAAGPGCRVRVRFAGRLISGYLLQRTAESQHEGKLGYLERVVSPEPVLTPEIAGLARAVADRYGGTLADVLRLAIPPRHAAAEARAAAAACAPGQPAAAQPASDPAGRAPRPGSGELPARPPEAPPPGPWSRYPAGPQFLAALAGGRAPRAIWSALPGTDWPEQIALAAAAAASAGRGSLIVVPDARDLDQVDAALAAALPPGAHITLAAGLGPAERYRRWLRVLRGEVTIVAGTRSAMFAPVTGLGLVVLWDEGDDLHAEPRAPYPHAREVLALRSYRTGAAALIGGFARTAEAQQMVSGGWAKPLEADRAAVRRHAPAVLAAGDDAELARDEAARAARLPSLALRTARAALATGPVLFQVPRRGYLAAMACERCRAPARCAQCGGPATLPGPQAPLRCGWCGALVPRRCARCAHTGLRAVVTGARRTAEELGRAFPAAAVRTSGGSTVLDRVPGSSAIVVATPGAEPYADGGYAAAVLLDGWELLSRPSLRAAEEALRRWMNAAALVRAGADGGTVIVVADAGPPAVQALVRWDPVTFAERELADRAELRFPPSVWMAALTGSLSAVTELLDAAELPAAAEVLGPVPVPVTQARGAAPPDGDVVRFLVRMPRSAGPALATALHRAQAIRTARKDPGTVRLQLDPAELI